MLKYYGDDAEMDAHQCEARGPGVTYPIGCVYGNHSDASMYEQITFAVAYNRIEGHANMGASWACRDTGYGDSLGENRCGGNSLWMSKSCGSLNPRAPHFIRMLEFLRSQQIDITVWDGEKAIAIANFYRLHREGKLPWSVIQ
jgi:hypothetical protein